MAAVEKCTKMLPVALKGRAGTRVRDAVTRMYIRRNMIAWPATETKC